MSFQFRFASILDLRRRQRDQVGSELGKANEAIRRVDEQIEIIRQQRQTLRQQPTHERVGAVQVEGLLAVGRYDMQLQADIGQLNQTRAELVIERDRRQRLLLDAEAEVKRFERLEEIEREAARMQMLRREQADADERSSQAYVLARLRRT